MDGLILLFQKNIPMQEITSPEIIPGIKGSNFSEIVITANDLREDVVVQASDEEKQQIIADFPKEKNNYLVVPRVIEE